MMFVSQSQRLLTTSIAFMMASILWVGAVEGQNIHATRSWSDVSGRFNTQAAYVDHQKDQVRLRLGDGRVIKLPTGRLSESDRDYLLAITTLQHTALQHDRFASQLNTDNFRGEGLLGALPPMTDKFPEGLAAPFYETVLHPYGSKQSASLTRAQRCGRRVEELIKRLRDHWPKIHSTTLGSVYNNLAVISARQQSVAGFTNFLQSSGEETRPRLLFATHHNASLVIAGEVKQKYRSELGRVLAIGSPDPGPAARQRLAYTFEHDSFAMPNKETQPPADKDGQPGSTTGSPPAGQETIGTGSGFLIAPDLVLTNAHVTTNGTAFHVRNDDGFACSASVEAVSPDHRVDLALLRLKTPATDLEPLRIANVDPPLQTELVLLGYPKPNYFEASLTSDRGSLSKYTDQGRTLMHSASSDPGNSGGPCVDNTGSVIGVLYAGSTVAANARNYAVSASATRLFLETLQTDLSSSPSSPADFAEVVSRVGPSVMLVTIYGEKTLAQPPSAARKSSGSAPLILYDECCLACGGSGLGTCGSCVGGYNQVPYTAVVAKKFNGELITAQKFKKVGCSRCKRGKVSCKSCGGSGDAR